MAKKRRRISITVSEAAETRLAQLRDQCRLRSTATVVEGMLNLYLWYLDHRDTNTPPPIRQSLEEEVTAMFDALGEWEATPEPGTVPVRHPNPNRYGEG